MKVYCVMTEFYDNGKVKAAMKEMNVKAMPKDEYRELPFMDAYNDYFTDKAEAETFLKEARCA